MSQEDLTQFLEAVRQDPSLQEKLRQPDADPVAIAKEAGFTITRPELIRAQAARIQELSDEDLEDAAGGGFWGLNTSPGNWGHNCIEGYGDNVACTRNTSTLGHV